MLLTSEQIRESFKDYIIALLLDYPHVVEVRTVVEEHATALYSVLDTNNLLILRHRTLDKLLRMLVDVVKWC